jgi:hypothetical protein
MTASTKTLLTRVARPKGPNSTCLAALLLFRRLLSE